MSLASLGEFGLIEQIDKSFTVPSGIKGIGDDCAVIPQQTGLDTLVSTDMLIEGIHFIRKDISAKELGWKSAAVNFSDIAAMGGRPTGTFLSFALPGDLEEEWVKDFIEGFRQMSEVVAEQLLGFPDSSSCIPLLGGDTTSSPGPVCINVTVTGECPHGSAKLRSGARAGDLICVTGPLGDSAAGLDVILKRQAATSGSGEKSTADGDGGLAEEESYLLSRHYHPIPRIREGLVLSSCEGVHAMMDISDGIASDLGHILKASGKAAFIELESIPLSPQMKAYCTVHGLDPYALATGGGEDYELLFTLDPTATPAIPFSVIGRITEGEGIEWKGSGIKYQGFRHF